MLNEKDIPACSLITSLASLTKSLCLWTLLYPHSSVKQKHTALFHSCWNYSPCTIRRTLEICNLIDHWWLLSDLRIGKQAKKRNEILLHLGIIRYLFMLHERWDYKFLLKEKLPSLLLLLQVANKRQHCVHNFIYSPAGIKTLFFLIFFIIFILDYSDRDL